MHPLNKLEAGRQAMLHERSRYIANIQNGTYLMWKEGFDQLEQFIALITTLFNHAECLIEMNLFAELVSRLVATFDRLAED